MIFLFAKIRYTKIVKTLLSHKISKYVFLASALAFFLVGFLELGRFGMIVRPDGQMSNCPFMGVAAVCQMNPLEHIAAWQNMFTVSYQKDIFAFLVLLLLAFLKALLLRNFWHIHTKEPLSVEAMRYRRINTLLILNPLQEAFSDGIIHPKIF